MSSQVHQSSVGHQSRPHLILTHHGLKAGLNASATGYTLPKAHVYIDCRGVPDGMGTKAVADWLVSDIFAVTPTVDAFVRLIEDHVNAMPTRRKGQDDPYADPIRVVFLCAWGQHRSKAVKEAIVEFLPGHWKVEVE